MDSRAKRRTASWLALCALALGCAGPTYSAAGRRDAYAQATCTDSVTCCVQRHPGNPEACGLSASEAAVLMAGQEATEDSTAEEWDDAHNAALPEWKRECIRFYGDCKDARLTGPCYDCLRRCEGQQEWPIDMCGPRRKRQ